MNHTYYVGSYCRFSSKEDDKTESNSITSQKEINQRFIEELNQKYPEDTFLLKEHYIDDDFTGTSFNRPDFARLKADCQSNKINCIVVKDNSRFGRNAARMQIILEEELSNIRFISNLDCFDSRFDDYDSMFQIRNTFNQMYAEDISRKVHSSIDSRQRSGKFTGSFCCYGYVKSRTDKNSLEVDENVRHIVELIFNLRLQGTNMQSIARQLNSLNIPPPSLYKSLQGLKYYNHNAAACEGPRLWTYSTIHQILTNETYCGNLTQGRVRHKIRKKPEKKARAEWVIVRDSVPAIVSSETFAEVQRLLKEANHIKAPANSKEHIFAGMIKCGYCNKAFVKHQKAQNALYFVCGTRRRHGKGACDNEYVRADLLEEIVLKDLNEILKEIKDWSFLIDNSSLPAVRVKQEDQIRLKQSERDLIIRKRRLAYEDYLECIISKTDFLHIKEETEQKEALLIRQIDHLEADQANNPGSPSLWLKALLDKKEIDRLDRMIVQEMIEAIYIYKEKINITYKFSQ